MKLGEDWIHKAVSVPLNVKEDALTWRVINPKGNAVATDTLHYNPTSSS